MSSQRISAQILWAVRLPRAASRHRFRNGVLSIFHTLEASINVILTIVHETLWERGPRHAGLIPANNCDVYSRWPSRRLMSRRILRPALPLLQMFRTATHLESLPESLVGAIVSPRLSRSRSSLHRGRLSGKLPLLSLSDNSVDVWPSESSWS